MKYITWNEAIGLTAQAKNMDVVTVIYMTDPNCPSCKQLKEMMKDVEIDGISFYQLEDQTDNPFPHTALPTTFIYAPGTKRNVSRVGVAPKDKIIEDLNRFVHCMKNGIDYDDYIKTI